MEISTGMQRGTELTVSKTIGGVTVSGYPKIYKLYEPFDSYAAVTVEELARLAVTEYRTRLSAFKAYVEGAEAGATVSVAEAYVENLTACPIG